MSEIEQDFGTCKDLVIGIFTTGIFDEKMDRTIIIICVISVVIISLTFVSFSLSGMIDGFKSATSFVQSSLVDVANIVKNGSAPIFDNVQTGISSLSNIAGTVPTLVSGTAKAAIDIAEESVSSVSSFPIKEMSVNVSDVVNSVRAETTSTNDGMSDISSTVAEMGSSVAKSFTNFTNVGVDQLQNVTSILGKSNKTNQIHESTSTTMKMASLGSQLSTTLGVAMPTVAVISGGTQIIKYLATPLHTALGVVNIISSSFSSVSSSISSASSSLNHISSLLSGGIIGFITTVINDDLAKLTSSSLYESIYESAASILSTMGCTLLNVIVDYGHYESHWGRVWEWFFDVIWKWGWVWKEITEWVVSHFSVCHDSECFIYTKCGMKRFKDLIIGDEILTHKGTYEKVTNMIVSKKDVVLLINGTTPEHPRVIGEGKLVSYKNSGKLAYLGIEEEKELQNRNIDIEFKDSILYTIELEGPVNTYMCSKDGKNAEVYKDIVPTFEKTPTASTLFLLIFKKLEKELLKISMLPERDSINETRKILEIVECKLRQVSMKEISYEDKINIDLLYEANKDDIRKIFTLRGETSIDRLTDFYYALYTLLYLYDGKISYSSMMEFF